MFDSPAIRHEVVWQTIPEEVEMSSKQCYDKWRYLKGWYMAIKDKRKQTGCCPFSFEFKAEMDEYMGGRPTVEPVSIMSTDNLVSLLSDEEDESPAKKPLRED